MDFTAAYEASEEVPEEPGRGTCLAGSTELIGLVEVTLASLDTIEQPLPF